MHPNPIYRQTAEPELRAFAAARGFGVLSVNGPEGPLLAHVPFRLEGDVAELHLVRSNPITRALTRPLPAVIAVSGPDGYISPDWYGMEDQVPTWNYLAVHLRGTLHLRPQEEMRGLLDRLSESFETRLAKQPWTSDKMTPEVLERLMRQIVPCRLELARIEGTWKLGQNKPPEARARVAQALPGSLGQELAALAGMMSPVTLDLSGAASEAEAHKIVAERLGFPPYYGANLDALVDCLRDQPTLSVNWLGPPGAAHRLRDVLREELGPRFHETPDGGDPR